MKVNLYPCCSATPAQTTLAVAPIRVPLPENNELSIQAVETINNVAITLRINLNVCNTLQKN